MISSFHTFIKYLIYCLINKLFNTPQEKNALKPGYYRHNFLPG
ncbi:hypothetical protein ASZ90_006658 [hydrocarbon metagenome]|uniref:Uncharacterized protein n=1 Tax=hydrocarbon metagenome TaxID=938273 RepID=A0A0W8FRM6_9ZZZZ